MKTFSTSLLNVSTGALRTRIIGWPEASQRISGRPCSIMSSSSGQNGTTVYAKPELSVLGMIKELVEYSGVPKQCGPPENVMQPVATAYDLDD